MAQNPKDQDQDPLMDDAVVGKAAGEDEDFEDVDELDEDSDEESDDVDAE
jgi:hypothetical protein